MRTSIGCLGLVLLAAFAPGCSTRPEPESRRIDSADDLIGALRDAGVDVDQTAMVAMSAGLFGGRVIFVGPERVEIYEQPTQAEREEALFELRGWAWPAAPPHLWSRGQIIVLYWGTDGPTIALLSGLLGDVLDLPGRAAVEPYPPAVAAAVSWLSESLGLDPGEVVVLDYTAQEWPDACLGLPGPDELCAGVITLGWHIVLEAGGDEHRVRTDELGMVIREEP